MIGHCPEDRGGLSTVEGPRIGRLRGVFECGRRDIQFDGIRSRCYEVAPDGQRFYAFQNVASPPPPVVTHVSVFQNWFEELKAKVPAGGQAT